MSLHSHRTLRVFGCLCVVLAALAGTNTDLAHATLRTSQVVISAVLPNPANGPEWVVIENRVPSVETKPLKTFLPIITAGDAGAKPIDTIGPPPTLTIIDIAGWQLGNGNMWFTIPKDLPPMPATAKVIVYFDGLGAAADDYGYDDGAAELHTPSGMVNVLPDTKGVILLYAGDVNTPANLRAKYEWGVRIDDFGLTIESLSH